MFHIATTHQQPNVDLNGDELHRGWAESYKGKCTETITQAGFKLLQKMIFKYATGRVVQSSAAPRRKVGHLGLQYQGMALHFR